MIESLQMIPIDKILFHEQHQEKRLDKIISNIASEKLLINPPIVMMTKSNQYLILDGAHRTLALRKNKCMNIAAQIVHEDQVSVSSWLHQIPKDQNIMEKIQSYSNICLLEEPLDGKHYFIKMILDEKNYYLYPNENSTNLNNFLLIWKEIVEMYTDIWGFKRLTKEEYACNSSTITFEFPELSISEILSVVENKEVLPAGVTRFILHCGRLLNLNIPINIIRSPEAYEYDWKELLENWKESLRLYTEPVYLCEV
ncbi:ParB N-terminal domain-containing protein [Bacillus sp. BP-3]|uniref:ParB N-terminal domain-containing protein n=1 Tax=Bacillus sp. BP-3 TaxID=3022773 RepID=UPI00232DFE20|nr:ParB N-terminal domain-containing protein [Bacillus sp. BP-3]MDC2866119.1 ParB N-terminal domain-containing protein [Bacillus sp. BP-3]